MSLDVSATSGTPAGTGGSVRHWVPKIVLLVVTWTYAVPVHGYWMLGGAGTIYHFGTAPGLGSASTLGAVDLEASSTGHGYWIVDSSGHVFAFGTAHSFGSAPALATPARCY